MTRTERFALIDKELEDASAHGKKASEHLSRAKERHAITEEKLEKFKREWDEEQANTFWSHVKGFFGG